MEGTELEDGTVAARVDLLGKVITRRAIEDKLPSGACMDLLPAPGKQVERDTKQRDGPGNEGEEGERGKSKAVAKKNGRKKKIRLDDVL
ncbi:hypothetical protein TNCV_4544731 [Trichonephila clavipes]|nr:hypothetical protein TNCV_4544731 [Trichonephila clavipes]